MKMQMKNRLAGVRTCVDHQPVAGFFDSFLAGDLPANRRQVPQERFIFRPDFIQGRDMPVGDDQDMDRGNRVIIPESSHQRIMVQDLCRNFAGYDFTKNTMHT
jgi:hypothetical protein